MIFIGIRIAKNPVVVSEMCHNEKNRPPNIFKEFSKNMNNSIDTQSLLLQMRSLAAEAASRPVSPQEVEKGAASSEKFSDILTNSINAVTKEQNKSSDMRAAFEKGKDIDLTEVMLQAQKASLSFQAMTQVRNRLVEAYREVARMPI